MIAAFFCLKVPASAGIFMRCNVWAQGYLARVRLAPRSGWLGLCTGSDAIVLPYGDMKVTFLSSIISSLLSGILPLILQLIFAAIFGTDTTTG
ncbi:MAG: hypothetical protein JSU63_18130 [Phycisphaerales bacterium]|nr:MAG: hypothetical protein JSU63_18130 [Phycisphaerales bacterium]